MMKLCLELLEPRCLPSTVTNLSDHDPGSLRDAIATTPSGGMVDFQPGLTGKIVLTSGELAISKDLTIDGPGADVIMVSGNKASRVFNNIGNFTVAISGLTIADGMVTGDDGGGIYNAGTLTITDSTFSGNAASNTRYSDGFGGGIGNVGTLTVTSCAFSKNTAMGLNTILPGGVGGAGGGGIFNASKGTLTITASTLSDNSAASPYFNLGGGGIYNQGTSAVTDSTFSGNSASADGGGGIENGGTLIVTNSTFHGNTVREGPAGGSWGGGGILNIGGTLTVADSTFSGNSAGRGGGGILNTYASVLSIPVFGTVTITDSTFSGNSASKDPGGAIGNIGTLTITASTFSGNSAPEGGGIESNGTLTVTASTFSGNSAASASYGYGGGIYSYLDTLTVADCTFSGNSASGGGGIYSFNGNFSVTFEIRNTLLAGNSAQSGGPDVFGGLTSFGHNLISDGSGGSGYAATDLVGTAASPIDPKLSPLQDNGGSTWTMALLPGSPAIGAGGPTDSEWDQRGPGYSRTVNGMTDIGAYEVQPSGAGSAALTLRPSELIKVVPVVPPSGPSKLSVPLRQAAAAVDRVFASWTRAASTLILGRARHPAVDQQDLWPFDFIPAV
jgi:hypothetical protein